MDYSALKPYFSEAEIRIYFGARTQNEINEAAAFMRNMSKADCERFKDALSTLNMMRMTEKTYGTR